MGVLVTSAGKHRARNKDGRILKFNKVTATSVPIQGSNTDTKPTIKDQNKNSSWLNETFKLNVVNNQWGK